MPTPDPLPEGTDEIIEGAGVADDDDKIGDETLFTPDEDPEADEPRGGDGGAYASGGAEQSAAGGGGGKGASGGGSTTGASFGTAALFDRIDEWKAQGYDRARDYAQVGIDRGAGAIDDVVRMINEAADQIDERVGAQYGGYARKAAENIGGFGDMLKGKDVDELFEQARDLVRKSPAVAIGTAAALGFVVARMARAGMPETADTGEGRGGGKASGGAA